jgi:hypothetical protein
MLVSGSFPWLTFLLGGDIFRRQNDAALPALLTSVLIQEAHSKTGCFCEEGEN